MSELRDMSSRATKLSAAPVVLTFVRDIEYFEGPLMSEFKAINDDRYLVIWRDLDREAKLNRWMVIFTRQRTIERYMNKELSMLDMIKKHHPACFFVDTAYHYQQDLNDGAWWTCDMSKVPNEYFPEATAYYDEDLSLGS